LVSKAVAERTEQLIERRTGKHGQRLLQLRIIRNCKFCPNGSRSKAAAECSVDVSPYFFRSKSPHQSSPAVTGNLYSYFI
jgi:hypothetical protein